MQWEPELPIVNIEISRANVRRVKVDQGLKELARSIDEIGLQQPIVVFEKGGKYYLVIGQRRFLACRDVLGLAHIPALITSITDETDAAVKSFSENIHTLDLDYEDKMRVAVQLLDKVRSVRAVAKRLGVDRATVRAYLGYAGVPEPIKKLVKEKVLGARTAIHISRYIQDETRALEIARKVVEEASDDARERLIAVARDNPEKSPGEVARMARNAAFTKLTLHLTPRVAQALRRAASEHGLDMADLATEVLQGWLSDRGFLS
jgi:ParB family chromosome partitioning protein